MEKERLSEMVFNGLKRDFGDAKCELEYVDAYTLLVAVVLSAQATDKRVNIITKELFRKYPTMWDIEKADKHEIESVIKSIGLYRSKAKSIKELTSDIINKYDGVLPADKEKLMMLRGVGEKTASVVLSEYFNVPAIAVDTHVFRVSRRLGLTKEETPEKVQRDLEKLIPEERWSLFHKMMVLFGRYNCKSRNPDCENCIFSNICEYLLQDN